MFDEKIILDLEKKSIVSDDPFPNTVIRDFLPEKIITSNENEFLNLTKTTDAGTKEFQKTKKLLSDYNQMPPTIKKTIDFLYSDEFLKFLEKKFQLKNLLADWKFHGGGLHESFKGGFLKIHSDFIYKRKSKLRRVLNLLLYLNSGWKKDWGGSIELWDKNMKTCKVSVLPEINTAVVFRTDKNSNHGFPDPLNCPENVSRKSLALYYYVVEKSFLPISIKRRKLFHAVWKKRPNIDEPKFADNDPLFKRLKHRFFYRFF